MGIYDRDYARSAGRPSGPLTRTLRTMSMTNWIIVVNIIVFVIDALLGARGLVVETHMGSLVAAQASTPSSAQVVDRSVTVRSQHGQMLAHPIVDQQTGQQIGEWRFMPMRPLESIGHFSTGKMILQLEVWRVVTFQFLHANASHILFNMMGLWFFGPAVERAIASRRRFLAFYLMCGICGALAYLTLNLLGAGFGLRLPGVLIEDAYTPLVGASAGVFGVLMAAAYVAGDAIMLVMLILPMRVRTGAYLMAAAALFNLLVAGKNAGGDAAHVGGAIAGFFFIRNSHLLGDFFDVFGGGKQSARRAGSGRARAGEAYAGVRLDAILDKVRGEGLHSLSDDDRDYLRRATEERRRGP